MGKYFAISISVLLLAGAAQAAPTNAQRCQASKNEAAGKYAACRQDAEAKLAATGDLAKYSGAITKCGSKFTVAWQNAIDKATVAGATCPDSPLTVADFQSLLDAYTANIATALGGGSLISSCGLEFDFDQAGINVDINGGETDTTQPIDLSQQADVQAHKANIKSMTLDSVDFTVTTIGAESGVTVNGRLALRPDGAADGSQDVLVGALTNFAVTVGSTVHLVGSPALDAFVLHLVKGSGRATAVIVGTSAVQSTHFTLDIKMHMSMAYST